MIKNLTCALVLLLSANGACSAEPCTSTFLSHAEAKQLILTVPNALAAIKMGGKLSIEPWEVPNGIKAYGFMLLSTASLPTSPIDNGLLGYYSVSKATGRVLDVAFVEVEGKGLAKLQGQLRLKHCISPSLLQEEKDDEQ